MAKVRLVLNRKGVAALLKSSGVADDMMRRAQAIASAAGDGMEPSVQIGRTRARASVITATDEAMEAEATTRRLTSAINAGRL